MDNKLLILCISVMGLNCAWGRQMIHCTSNTNDERAMIELKNNAGRFELYQAKRPKMALSKNAAEIKVIPQSTGYTKLVVKKPQHRETILLPNSVIGKASSGFIGRFIHLTLKKNISYERNMSCYSSIAR